MSDADCEARYLRVKAAFEADGFDLVPLTDPESPAAPRPYLRRRDSIACAARHRTARNTVTKEPKTAFYVEGSNYLMGWFMGLMAEPAISRMANEYCDNVVFDFFDIESFVRAKSPLAERIKDLIIEIIYEHSQEMIRDVPYEYVNELKGMLDGCAAANESTTVSWERLWGLNYGIDCLIAHIYSGRLFGEAKVHPTKLRVPVGCNAFGLSGAAAGGASLFGRDFMFPTAGVFQDVACVVIYRPEPLEGVARRAFASQTAPGIIGSVAAMNDLGVGIGIEMLPSSYCDAKRPGFNSLGLNRDVAQYCADSPAAVERIAQTQRGVSWIYALSDASGKACILETGRKPAKDEAFPYDDYVSEYYKRLLPDPDFLEEMRADHGYSEPDRGVFPRWAGFKYPFEFIANYNRKLFEAYNRKFPDRLFDRLRGLAGCLLALVTGKFGGPLAFFASIAAVFAKKARWDRCDSGERGFYCANHGDQNIPGPYYFAPQRETRDDLVLVTNAFLSPEMRPLCMSEWIAFIAGASLPDFQWRYDALNVLILDAIAGSPGGIGFEEAWKLIDYLDPLRSEKYKDYYNPGGHLDPATIKVGGSVNLFDLAGLSMRSLWGYYGDEAVDIKLARYL